MTKRELAEGIHQVEDRLIAEADNYDTQSNQTDKRKRQFGRKRHSFGIIAAASLVAAVFIIAIAGEFFLFGSSYMDEMGNASVTSDSSENGVSGKKRYKKKAVALAASPTAYPVNVIDSEKFQKKLWKEHPVEDSFYDALRKFTFRTTSAYALSKYATSSQSISSNTSNTISSNTISSNAISPKVESLQKNFLYSPLSLYYALAVTANGAAGETQEELGKLLEMPTAEDLVQQCENLYHHLYRNNTDGRFQMANSLWMAKEIRGIPVLWQEEYLNCASKEFYASIFSVDFQDKTTYQDMREWVSDETEGMLSPNLEPDLPVEEGLEENGSEQVLGILNTIYIKDRWKNSFYEEFTREEEFYLADGTTVKVPFMCQWDSGEFFLGDGFLRAELELEQIGSMVFVLPEEGVLPEDLFANEERLEEAFTGGNRYSGNIHWQVPKFTFGMTDRLEELLQQLGVKKAFEAGEADFSSMIDYQNQDRSVWISQVSQGTKLIVEEGGIEAAAYTYVALEDGGEGNSPKEGTEMVLNRPFLYGILQDGVYTFMGVCNNPTLEE